MSIETTTKEIKFNCTHCQQSISTGTDTAGIKAQCPACAGSIVVPSGEQPHAVRPALEESADSKCKSDSGNKLRQHNKLRASPKTLAIGLSIIVATFAAFYFFVLDNRRKDHASEDKAATKEQSRDSKQSSKSIENLVVLGYEHASKKNYSKAVDYFTEAAEHGNAVAQFKLSEFYISGLGVSKDHKKGLDSLKKAADQDLIIAQISYGSYLTDGKHLKQDLTRSLMWLNLALDPQRDHSKTDKKTLAMGHKLRKLVIDVLSQKELSKAKQMTLNWRKENPLSRKTTSSEAISNPRLKKAITEIQQITNELYALKQSSDYKFISRIGRDRVDELIGTFVAMQGDYAQSKAKEVFGQGKGHESEYYRALREYKKSTDRVKYQISLESQ